MSLTEILPGSRRTLHGSRLAGGAGRCLTERADSGRRLRVSSLSAAVLMALYGSQAAADDNALQEVVVTATRRALSVEDVPISITAVSGSTLEQAGIQDIAGLARSVAGVNYTDKGPYGGVSGSTLIIRGLNSEATSDLAFPTPIVPPVATYVDETPLFVNLRLQDLDHVEILRGPQGTLYGSGSLGGTVRFVQNAPDPSGFDAKAEVGASKTDHTHAVNDDFSGMLNLPVTDTFAVRLNASFTDQAGFINQPNLFVLGANGVPVPQVPGNLLSPPKEYAEDGVNSYGYRTARVAALWKPNEDFHAQLSYYYQVSNGNGYPYSSPEIYGAKSLSSADDLLETVRDKVDLVALTVEYDLGFATMTSASSWAHHSNQTLDDGTAVYENFSFYQAYYGGNPRAVFDRRAGLDDKLAAQELRLTSKAGGFFDWVGGAFYKNENSYIQDHEYYPGYNDFYNSCVPQYGSGSPQCGGGEFGQITGTTSVDGIALVKDQAYIGDFETHFTDLAAFGELTGHLTSAWSVTGGTRLFKQEVTQSQQTGLLFVGPAFIANQSLTDEWRRPLWKINTAYQLNPTNLAYATWSQGFRRGGVNALPVMEPGYLVPPALTKVNPDTANNYELGVKGTLMDRYRYSAAIYDIQWKNIQEGAQLTPLVLPGAINVGDGYSRGLEFELFGRLTDHLSSQLGYTYDRTALTSLSALAEVGLSIAPAPGSQLPGTPKNSLELGFDYGHVPLAGGVLQYAIDAHYQSRVIPSISASVPIVAGYTIGNARTSFTLANWVGTLYVDNFTNALGVSSYTDPAGYGKFYSAIVSRPRTIGISLAYSFKKH
jgi:iron complex outermembrane receptor protein